MKGKAKRFVFFYAKNKFRSFDYTLVMLMALITVLLLILILPIGLNLRFFINFTDKKIFYSIKLYGLIKANCGYIDFAKGRIILRYNDKKTKALKFKDMLLDDNKVNAMSHFDYLTLRSAVLLGGEKDAQKLLGCLIINSVNSTIGRFFKAYKPYSNYKNDVILLGEKDSSGFIGELKSATNLVSIIEILIKKIYKGALEYVKGKTK